MTTSPWTTTTSCEHCAHCALGACSAAAGGAREGEKVDRGRNGEGGGRARLFSSPLLCSALLSSFLSSLLPGASVILVVALSSPSLLPLPLPSPPLLSSDPVAVTRSPLVSRDAKTIPLIRYCGNPPPSISLRQEHHAGGILLFLPAELTARRRPIGRPTGQSVDRQTDLVLIRSGLDQILCYARSDQIFHQIPSSQKDPLAERRAAGRPAVTQTSWRIACFQNFHLPECNRPLLVLRSSNPRVNGTSRTLVIASTKIIPLPIPLPILRPSIDHRATISNRPPSSPATIVSVEKIV
mmetsp:Transcript_60303/g.123913  ORF Transcript_60303/g.123913 Transcript_60303/m.123913 type:complete len:296 (+) Transcript_60303:812-1699(+)